MVDRNSEPRRHLRDSTRNYSEIENKNQVKALRTDRRYELLDAVVKDTATAVRAILLMFAVCLVALVFGGLPAVAFLRPQLLVPVMVVFAAIFGLATITTLVYAIGATRRAKASR